MWKHTNRLAHSCGSKECEMWLSNVVDVTVYKNSCTNYNNAPHTMFHFSSHNQFETEPSSPSAPFFPLPLLACLLQMRLCTQKHTRTHTYILSKRNERQSIKFRRKYFSSLSVFQSIRFWSPISRFQLAAMQCVKRAMRFHPLTYNKYY